jgi:hypothetical protein
MRHAVFLEDELMRGSMVARKIDLEEKRVHAPNPLIQEPFFSLPVVPAPTIPQVAVQAPVVTPPITTRCGDSEPVRQEPTEPFVEHERELQQPPLIDVPEVEIHNEPENEAVGVLDTGVSRSTCSWAPSSAHLWPRGESTTQATEKTLMRRRLMRRTTAKTAKDQKTSS